MVSLSVVHFRFATLMLLLSNGRPVTSYTQNYTRYEELFSLFNRVLRESNLLEIICSELDTIEIQVSDDGNSTAKINGIQSHFTPIIPIFNPPFVCSKYSVPTSAACEKMIRLGYKLPMERNSAFLTLTMGMRVALFFEYLTQRSDSGTKFHLVAAFPAITMFYYFKYLPVRCIPAGHKVETNKLEINDIGIEFNKGSTRQAMRIRSELFEGIRQGPLANKLGEFYFVAHFSSMLTSLADALKSITEDAFAQVFSKSVVVDEFCSVIYTLF